MTIQVNFRVKRDRFRLGEFLAEEDSLQAELERIVPTDGSVIPYVWVTGDPESLNGLQESFEESTVVTSYDVLDELTVTDSDSIERLYRVEWLLEDMDIIQGIIDNEGEILEGIKNGEYWTLTFRFPEHQYVADFYQYLTEAEIRDFDIESIYELERRSDRDKRNPLTPEQRGILEAAAEAGYFNIPRESELTEIGDELDITEQAASELLRRATQNLVYEELNLPLDT